MKCFWLCIINFVAAMCFGNVDIAAPFLSGAIVILAVKQS